MTFEICAASAAVAAVAAAGFMYLRMMFKICAATAAAVAAVAAAGRMQPRRSRQQRG